MRARRILVTTVSLQICQPVPVQYSVQMYTGRLLQLLAGNINTVRAKHCTDIVWVLFMLLRYCADICWFLFEDLMKYCVDILWVLFEVGIE